MPTDGRSRRSRVIGTYGNICWLCLDLIDLSLVCPDPKSFTVDHVVPRGEGGSNGIHNLRSAHRECNENKADKVPWNHQVNGRALRLYTQPRVKPAFVDRAYKRYRYTEADWLSRAMNTPIYGAEEETA